MTVYGVWVINKAGGLIFQRNYGGKPSPHEPLEMFVDELATQSALLSCHQTNISSWLERYTVSTPSPLESRQSPRVPEFRQ